MAHPLRLRILRLCLHDALTNKEIADRLGQDPATTLHHVRLLADRIPRGRAAAPAGSGALEKPYRSTGKSWVLSVPRPEDLIVSALAAVDAVLRRANRRRRPVSPSSSTPEGWPAAVRRRDRGAH